MAWTGWVDVLVRGAGELKRSLSLYFRETAHLGASSPRLQIFIQTSMNKMQRAREKDKYEEAATICAAIGIPLFAASAAREMRKQRVKCRARDREKKREIVLALKTQ